MVINFSVMLLIYPFDSPTINLSILIQDYLFLSGYRQEQALDHSINIGTSRVFGLGLSLPIPRQNVF